MWSQWAAAHSFPRCSGSTWTGRSSPVPGRTSAGEECTPHSPSKPSENRTENVKCGTCDKWNNDLCLLELIHVQGTLNLEIKIQDFLSLEVDEGENLPQSTSRGGSTSFWVVLLDVSAGSSCCVCTSAPCRPSLPTRLQKSPIWTMNTNDSFKPSAEKNSKAWPNNVWYLPYMRKRGQLNQRIFGSQNWTAGIFTLTPVLLLRSLNENRSDTFKLLLILTQDRKLFLTLCLQKAGCSCFGFLACTIK